MVIEAVVLGCVDEHSGRHHISNIYSEDQLSASGFVLDCAPGEMVGNDHILTELELTNMYGQLCMSRVAHFIRRPLHFSGWPHRMTAVLDPFPCYQDGGSLHERC